MSEEEEWVPMAPRILVVVAMCALLASACSSPPAPRPPAVARPARGRPLSAPGVLLGRWLAEGVQTALVLESMESRPDELDLARFGGTGCDVFRLSLAGTTDPMVFLAAHGKLGVQAFDVDGDGLDEVVLEHAIGRGTFVTVRHLQVLKLVGGRFRSVLDVPLDDYLWAAERRDPLLLRRRYELLEGHSSLLRIELEPIDLGGLPAPKDVESSLQQVRLDLVYDRALGEFDTVDCVTRPMGAVLAGGRS